MEFEYKLNPDNKIVVAKFSGQYDVEAYGGFYNELMTAIKGTGIHSILWDVRDLDATRITHGELHRQLLCSKSWLSVRKGGKSAIVVKDLLGFGIGRMLQNISESRKEFNLDIELKIMKNFDKALEWLRQDASL